MGFIYIMIALFVLLLMFIFTKKNKELAWLSGIPLFILFICVVLLPTMKVETNAFVDKYEMYKCINTHTDYEPMVRYKIMKDIIDINNHIEYNRELSENAMFSVFASEKIANLELIELEN